MTTMIAGMEFIVMVEIRMHWKSRIVDLLCESSHEHVPSVLDEVFKLLNLLVIAFRLEQM